MALYKILLSGNYEVISLLTSVNDEYKRISMHGVCESLLDEQVRNIGLPLVKMRLSEKATMEEYESEMTMLLSKLKEKGASASVFGDIFLEDLRKYREEKLAQINLQAIFPLWKMNTKDLLYEFLDLGFKTIITCVNEKFLDKSFAGRIIDREFIKDLPSGVDPCGENGEFHTFVFDGPLFKNPILFEKGKMVYRKYDHENPGLATGFWYCDLVKK